MNYLLTISFHNEQIADISYEQLIKTTSTEPCKVLLLDNNYPLLKNKDHIKNICKKYDFEYFNVGRNIGDHEGYNYLIKQLPNNCDRYILYDGDSYPITPDWHIPLLKVHDDSSVIWSSLHNKRSFEEMYERGFYPALIENYYCTVPKAPVINSVCAIKKSWAESIGEFTEPNKYYGGFEIAQWNKKKEDLKWVFLNDFKEENIPNISEIQDKIYTEYKWEHAHKGNPLSFEEYINKQYGIAK